MLSSHVSSVDAFIGALLLQVLGSTLMTDALNAMLSSLYLATLVGINSKLVPFFFVSLHTIPLVLCSPICVTSSLNLQRTIRHYYLGCNHLGLDNGQYIHVNLLHYWWSSSYYCRSSWSLCVCKWISMVMCTVTGRDPQRHLSSATLDSILVWSSWMTI